MIRFNFRRLLGASFLALSVSGLGAADIDEAFLARNGGAVIAEVRYAGNAKTSRETLDRLTGLRPGTVLGAAGIENAKQALLKTNLYEEVRFEADAADGRAVVTVRVKEKMSRIFLPFASFSASSWMAGGGLLDMNWRGAQQSLFAGGTGGSDGGSAFLSLTDPAAFGGRFSVGYLATASRATRRMETMDGAEYYSGREVSAAGSLSVGRRLTDHLIPRLELLTSYTGRESGDALGNSAVLAAGAGFQADYLKSDGTFLNGAFFDAAFHRNFFDQDDSGYTAANARGSLSAVVFRGHLEAGASGEYGDKGPAQARALGGKGFRCVPQQTSFSPKYAAGYLEYYYPIFRNAYGTLTFNAFGERGVYRCWGCASSSYEDFSGVGLGLSYYLSKVAIQAVGLNVGWNLGTETYVVSASLGISIN